MVRLPATPVQAPGGAVDYEHCPTCEQALVPCGAILPTTAHDVQPVRCRLPAGHRSAEHWHPPLWPSTPSLLWFDDE
jgi:hypothetical protein